ncbi:hypothetical protein A3206_02700 [Candidatus Methanomassiliicoccus intestinalis]|nr:MAG: hypothetical protein A3206_02700 [Candidatus Methanomassiliicoccus intestinalis]
MRDDNNESGNSRKNAIQVLEDKHKLSILLDLYDVAYTMGTEIEDNDVDNVKVGFLVSGDIRKKYANNNRISIKLDELEEAGLVIQERRKSDHNKIHVYLTPLGISIARSLDDIYNDLTYNNNSDALANLVDTFRESNDPKLKKLLDSLFKDLARLLDAKEKYKTELKKFNESMKKHIADYEKKNNVDLGLKNIDGESILKQYSTKFKDEANEDKNPDT